MLEKIGGGGIEQKSNVKKKNHLESNQKANKKTTKLTLLLLTEYLPKFWGFLQDYTRSSLQNWVNIELPRPWLCLWKRQVHSFLLQVESLETRHMKRVLYFMGSNLFEVSGSTKSFRSICGVMKWPDRSSQIQNPLSPS